MDGRLQEVLLRRRPPRQERPLRKVSEHENEVQLGTPASATGLPGQYDTVGNWQKCHINRLSYYLMIFTIRRSFLATKKLSYKAIVILSGVVLSGEPCNPIVPPQFELELLRKVCIKSPWTVV